MADADQIAAPGEGENLRHFHPVGVGRFETKLDFLGVRSKFALTFDCRIERPVVGQTLADQATLCGILVLAFKEQEGLGLVGHRLVVIELQADQVTTDRRNTGDKKIGLDRDDFTPAVTGGYLCHRHSGFRRLRGDHTRNLWNWRTFSLPGDHCRLYGRRGRIEFLPRVPEHEQ